VLYQSLSVTPSCHWHVIITPFEKAAAKAFQSLLPWQGPAGRHTEHSAGAEHGSLQAQQSDGCACELQHHRMCSTASTAAHLQGILKTALPHESQPQHTTNAINATTYSFSLSQRFHTSKVPKPHNPRVTSLYCPTSTH
jgi:hypothetical protein